MTPGFALRRRGSTCLRNLGCEMEGPNELCPNPSCDKGAVDTGGQTLWGAPITEVCPICKGHCFITQEEKQELTEAVDPAEESLSI